MSQPGAGPDANAAARLAAFERICTDGLCSFTADGQLQHANPVARRLLGLERVPEAVGADGGGFCDADGRPLAPPLDPIRAAAVEGVPRTVELYWRQPAGELTRLSLSLTPLGAAEGGATEVLAVVRNTVETTALSEQLGRLMSDSAQQRHLLNLVFENVDSGIALVDSNDRVTLWNRPFERVWGLSPSAAEGRTSEDLLRAAPWDFTPAQRRVFEADIASARESLDPMSFEIRSQSHALQFYTCRLAGGRRLWAVRDLTEWRRMTAELSAAREAAEAEQRLLQLVFANVEEALVVVDADGRVITCNPVFSRMWAIDDGWLRERPDGAPTTECSACHLAPAQLARLDQLAATGDRSGRDIGLAGEGGTRWVHVYSAGLADGSRLYAFLDTTAQRRLEASLAARNEQLAFALAEQAQTLAELAEANRKLAESDRLKSEFLANTSHELRTPMNSILGYLDLISEGLYKDHDELNHWAATAHRSATSLLAVINSLLDIARIESGQMRAMREPVTLWLALDEVAEELRPQVSEKRLTLDLPPQDLALQVLVDPVHLRQILMNVMGNAVKFTEAGDVAVACGRAGNKAWVTVHDTGIGIPADKIGTVFDKFVQVDGSSSRPYGGTGLGLAITRSLLGIQGGQIEVRSDGPGQGTLVRIELPCP